MIPLIRAEFLKLRTTQVWFWLLVATLAVSFLLVFAPLLSDGAGTYDTAQTARLFSGSTNADIVVFVLGVLGVTTEFRYQTITPTLLQTPSRWAVVGAKMITYAVLGVIYAALGAIVQLATAVPWLTVSGASVDYADTRIVHALVGVLGVVALYGIIGLGIGALLKNQIVAVSVGIVFLLILENIVLAIPGVRVVWPYTPAGASAAILHVNGSTQVVGSVHLLPLWGGVLVLLLWAFVPALAGAAFTLNRDIT